MTQSVVVKSTHCHAHPSAGGVLDKHTASLCSSRSLRTLVWAEVASSQFSSSGTDTMWSRILQPWTQTEAFIHSRLTLRSQGLLTPLHWMKYITEKQYASTVCLCLCLQFNCVCECVSGSTVNSTNSFTVTTEDKRGQQTSQHAVGGGHEEITDLHYIISKVQTMVKWSIDGAAIS